MVRTCMAMNRALSTGATICPERLLEAQPQLVAAERQQMDQAPYLLDHDRRAAVLEAIREVCLHRGWGLLAAHVRMNHVHVVVEAEARAREGHERFQKVFQPQFESTWDR